MRVIRWLFLVALLTVSNGLASVRVEEVPEGGLQPEVVVALGGVVHLVYLLGEPEAADVRYTWRKPGKGWEPSQTVNAPASRAVAVGTVRGPLVAWAEGTGWNRGGEAAWQAFDSNLLPLNPPGRAQGVSVWGRVAVYAEMDGGFVILR